jgi:hypothetical protein
LLLLNLLFVGVIIDYGHVSLLLEILFLVVASNFVCVVDYEHVFAVAAAIVVDDVFDDAFPVVAAHCS